MAKEVVWTKIILETFLEESGILDRIELGDEKVDYSIGESLCFY